MITIGYKTKFDSIVRAVGAIGIGIVMVFGNDAPTLVVKIIAGLLIAAGVASLFYGMTKRGVRGMYELLLTNAFLDIVVGLLLFFNPQWVANFIVYLIGIVLVLFGALQLVVLAGTMALLGAGFASLILSIFAIIGGAFLLFNPFTLNVMSIIAGCLMVLYGISELISMWRVVNAKKEYEIRRASAPPEPSDTRGLDVSGLGDAKEVEYEKVDGPRT